MNVHLAELHPEMGVGVGVGVIEVWVWGSANVLLFLKSTKKGFPIYFPKRKYLSITHIQKMAKILQIHYFYPLRDMYILYWCSPDTNSL